jgi:hypothetical protein
MFHKLWDQMKTTLFHNLAPFTHTQRGRARGEKNNPKTDKQIRKERKAKKQLKSTIIRVGSVVAASKVKNVFSEFPPSSPKKPTLSTQNSTNYCIHEFPVSSRPLRHRHHL